MKQTLEYYYSLNIDEVMLEKGTYHFVYNNEDYYFVFYNRPTKDLEDIVECSRELKSKKIECHDIILNNKGNILTLIDEANYILLKVYNKEKVFSIVDIIDMNKKVKLSSGSRRRYVNNWAKLWSEKIDYIETQLNEIKFNRVIISSVDYYIGLCENAIYYINLINQKYTLSSEDNIVLSHKRIYYPNYSLNYLNPLSFVFDLEVRDVAEYIKCCFFEGDDAFLELQTFLRSKPLTIYSYNMLYARLLYPSYYFDLYENYLTQKDLEKILKVISKSTDYEKFLKKAYKEISLYASLESINWLIY